MSSVTLIEPTEELAVDSTSPSSLSDAHRPVITVGLLAIGLIHTLDLPGKFHETPYLGVAYIILIVATVLTALDLIDVSRRRSWTTAIAISVAPMIGYLLSRSVGLPGARGDIGNWLEPLGLASVFVEAAVVMFAVQALVCDRRGRRSNNLARPAMARRG